MNSLPNLEARLRDAFRMDAHRARRTNARSQVVPIPLRPRGHRAWLTAAAAGMALAVGGGLALLQSIHSSRTLAPAVVADSSLPERPASATPGSGETVASTPAVVKPAPSPPQAFTTADIPPLSGPDDSRSPIQRFLGVPASLEDAARWDFDLVQRAIRECMSERGFDYTIPGYGSSDAAAGQSAEYAAALYGTDSGSVDNSCERVASDRVHPLNQLTEGVDDMRVAILAEPDVVAAVGEKSHCLTVAGFDDASAPTDVRAFCDAATGVTKAINAAREIHEVVFMNDHYEYFMNFRLQLDELKNLD